MVERMLRTKIVCGVRGVGPSTHYADISAGLFVKPVSIGKRARAYPESEVAALNSARIAGKTDDEIRALVLSLEAARKVAK